MVRAKSIIVLLLSLWLPLQGFGAVVMPFCKHSLAASAGQTHSDHAQHDGHSGDDGTIAVFSTCDDCGHCHLATASTLPASTPGDTTFASNASPFITLAALRGIVLPSLRRPPLLTLS